jgi:ribosomal protein S14
MITNDFTSRQMIMMEFYTNQYIQTTNQIQTLMDKQTDLLKLIRELNDYQYLLVSRQTELLRSLNQLCSITNSQLTPEPINQTFTPNILPSANQEPLSETIRNSSIPQGYYPNLNQPLSTPRSTRNNTSRFTESLPQLPPRTTPTTSTSSTFDNYLVYTFLPNETSRTTTRTPQTLNSTNLASSFLETFIDEFLNPVSTAPTNDQIQEATTSITYREITNPVNTNCPISLNTFQPEDIILQINRCRHNYTPSSLLEWFRSNNHCPLCRIDIREVAEELE